MKKVLVVYSSKDKDLLHIGNIIREVNKYPLSSHDLCYIKSFISCKFKLDDVNVLNVLPLAEED